MMDPRDEGSALPLNLEAEQAVLGQLMFDNEVHRQFHDLITDEDFSEPFHQRLYLAIATAISAGKLAEPTTLQTGFATDPAFNEFGGFGYLFDLVDRAPPAANARAYAEQIADTAVRRRLIKMAAEAMQAARNPEQTGYHAVAEARAALEAAERGAAPEDAMFVNAHDAAQARMDRLELEVAAGKPNIRRQKDPVLLGAVKHLAKGEVSPAMRLVLPHVTALGRDTPEAAYAKAAHDAWETGRASLAAGPVSLGIAEERNKAFLQVLADPKGEYRLAQRGSNLVLTTPTLLPRTPTPKHRTGIEVDVHSHDKGLVIEFPKDWKIASD